MAGDSCLGGHLCSARMAKPCAIDLDLYLASIGDDSTYRVVGMEASTIATESCAIIHRARRTRGVTVRRCGSGHDGTSCAPRK